MADEKWFVVSYWDTYEDDVPPEERISKPENDDTVWTISKDPKNTGWENDCDQQGYGFTRKEAQAIVDKLNSHTRSQEVIRKLVEETQSFIELANVKAYPTLPKKLEQAIKEAKEFLGEK